MTIFYGFCCTLSKKSHYTNALNVIDSPHQFHVGVSDADSDFAIDRGRSFDVLGASLQESRAAFKEAVGENVENVFGSDGG